MGSRVHGAARVRRADITVQDMADGEELKETRRTWSRLCPLGKHVFSKIFELPYLRAKGSTNFFPTNWCTKDFFLRMRVASWFGVVPVGTSAICRAVGASPLSRNCLFLGGGGDSMLLSTRMAAPLLTIYFVRHGETTGNRYKLTTIIHRVHEKRMPSATHHACSI